METAFIVLARDGTPYMAVTTSAKRSRFRPLKNAAKNLSSIFADEYRDVAISKGELSAALDAGMTVEGPMPVSALSAKIRSARTEVPKEKKILPAITISDVPLGDFSEDEFLNIVSFKAASFVTERYKSTYNYEVKRIRAIFDRLLRIPGTSRRGGWRCPPGVTGGGQITDRFGSTCGGAVARRLSNAISDLATQAGTIGDDGGSRRQRRRVRRVTAAQGESQPGPIERGLRSVARRLEGEPPAQQAPRRERIPEVRAPEQVAETAESVREQVQEMGRIERALRRIADRLEGRVDAERKKRPKGRLAEQRDVVDADVPAPVAETADRVPRRLSEYQEFDREMRERRERRRRGEPEPEPTPATAETAPGATPDDATDPWKPYYEPRDTEQSAQIGPAVGVESDRGEPFDRFTVPVNTSALMINGENLNIVLRDEEIQRNLVRELLSHDQELLGKVFALMDVMSPEQRLAFVFTLSRELENTFNSQQRDYWRALFIGRHLNSEFRFSVEDKAELIASTVRNVGESLATLDDVLRRFTMGDGDEFRTPSDRELRTLVTAVKEVGAARLRAEVVGELMRDNDILPDDMRQVVNSGIAAELKERIQARMDDYPSKQQHQFAKYVVQRYGDGPLPWEEMDGDQFEAMNYGAQQDYLLAAFSHDEIVASDGSGRKFKIRALTAELYPGRAGHSEPQWVVTGAILDENGRQIGEFERVLHPESGYIEHKLFKIDDEDAKGQGIANLFNQQAYRFLQPLGYNKSVIKSVGWDGGYVWGRIGFQSGSEGGDIGRSARTYLTEQMAKYVAGQPSIISSPEQLALISSLMSEPDGVITHQMLIFALEGEPSGNPLADEVRKTQIKQWILNNARFSHGTLRWENLGLISDPRPLAGGNVVPKKPDAPSPPPRPSDVLEVLDEDRLESNLKVALDDLMFNGIVDGSRWASEEGGTLTREFSKITESDLEELGIPDSVSIDEVRSTLISGGIEVRDSEPTFGSRLGLDRDKTLSDDYYKFLEKYRLEIESARTRLQMHATGEQPLSASEYLELVKDIGRAQALIRRISSAQAEMDRRRRRVLMNRQAVDEARGKIEGLRRASENDPAGDYIENRRELVVALQRAEQLLDQVEEEQLASASGYLSMGEGESRLTEISADKATIRRHHSNNDEAFDFGRNQTELGAAASEDVRELIDALDDLQYQLEQNGRADDDTLYRIFDRIGRIRGADTAQATVLDYESEIIERKTVEGPDFLRRGRQRLGEIRKSIDEYFVKQRRVGARYFIEKFGEDGELPWAGMTPQKFRDMDEDEQLAYLVEAFSHTRIVGKDGRIYRVQVTIADSFGPNQGAYIEGVIYDSRGNQVGEFRRAVRLPGSYGGIGYVDNDLFTLSQSNRGNDLNTIFAQQAYHYLAAIGVESAEISQTAWDGKFVWARVGFQSSYGIEDYTKAKLRNEIRDFRLGQRSVIESEEQAELIEALLEDGDVTHQELIYALGWTEASDARKTEIKNWMQDNAPIDSSSLSLSNVVDLNTDPRTLLGDSERAEAVQQTSAPSESQLRSVFEDRLNEILPILSPDESQANYVASSVRNAFRARLDGSEQTLGEWFNEWAVEGSFSEPREQDVFDAMPDDELLREQESIVGEINGLRTRISGRVASINAGTSVTADVRDEIAGSVSRLARLGSELRRVQQAIRNRRDQQLADMSRAVFRRVEAHRQTGDSPFEQFGGPSTALIDRFNRTFNSDLLWHYDSRLARDFGEWANEQGLADRQEHLANMSDNAFIPLRDGTEQSLEEASDVLRSVIEEMIDANEQGLPTDAALVRRYNDALDDVTRLRIQYAMIQEESDRRNRIQSALQQAADAEVGTTGERDWSESSFHERWRRANTQFLLTGRVPERARMLRERIISRWRELSNEENQVEGTSLDLSADDQTLVDGMTPSTVGAEIEALVQASTYGDDLSTRSISDEQVDQLVGRYRREAEDAFDRSLALFEDLRNIGGVDYVSEQELRDISDAFTDALIADLALKRALREQDRRAIERRLQPEDDAEPDRTATLGTRRSASEQQAARSASRRPSGDEEEIPSTPTRSRQVSNIDADTDETDIVEQFEGTDDDGGDDVASEITAVPLERPAETEEISGGLGGDGNPDESSVLSFAPLGDVALSDELFEMARDLRTAWIQHERPKTKEQHIEMAREQAVRLQAEIGVAISETALALNSPDLTEREREEAVDLLKARLMTIMSKYRPTNLDATEDEYIAEARRLLDRQRELDELQASQYPPQQPGELWREYQDRIRPLRDLQMAHQSQVRKFVEEDYPNYLTWRLVSGADIEAQIGTLDEWVSRPPMFDPDAFSGPEILGADAAEVIAKRILEARGRRLSAVLDYVSKRHPEGFDDFFDGIAGAGRYGRRLLGDVLRPERVLEALWTHDEIIGKNGKRYRVTASVTEDFEEDPDHDWDDSDDPETRPYYSISLQIDEIDENGNVIRARVGSGNRYVYPEGSWEQGIDEPFVYHGGLFIGDRGNGLASIINGYAFLGLPKVGFDTVHISAIDDGPYVWARVGFSEGALSGSQKESIRRELASFERFGPTPLIQNAEQYALLKQVFNDRYSTHIDAIFALSEPGESVERALFLKEWFKRYLPFDGGDLSIRIEQGQDVFEEAGRQNRVARLRAQGDAVIERPDDTPDFSGGFGDGASPVSPLLSVSTSGVSSSVSPQVTEALEELFSVDGSSRLGLEDSEANLRELLSGRGRMSANVASEIAKIQKKINEIMATFAEEIDLVADDKEKQDLIDNFVTRVRGVLADRTPFLLRGVDRKGADELIATEISSIAADKRRLASIRQDMLDSTQRASWERSAMELERRLASLEVMLTAHSALSTLDSSGLLAQIDALATSVPDGAVFDPDDFSGPEVLGGNAAQIISGRIDEARVRRLGSLLAYIEQRDASGTSGSWTNPDSPQIPEFRFMSLSEKIAYAEELYSHPLIIGKNGKRYRVTAKATPSSLYGDNINVDLEIVEIDENGQVLRYAGQGSRAIYFNGSDDTYTPHVYNANLNVFDKNAGIASIINGWAYTGLSRAGINEVHVTAIDDGAYVWARMGFVDNPLESYERDAIEQELSTFERLGPTPLIQTPQQYFLLRHVLRDRTSTHIDAIFALSEDTDTPERSAFLKEWFMRELPTAGGILRISEEQSPAVRDEALRRRQAGKSLRPKGRIFGHIIEAKTIIAMSSPLPDYETISPRISIKAGTSVRPKNAPLVYGDLRAAVLSKGLGRPIGGVSDIDGDGDGFVTGPDGEDNIPAVAATLVQRAQRGRPKGSAATEDEDKGDLFVYDIDDMVDILPNGWDFFQDVLDSDVFTDSTSAADEMYRAGSRASRVLDAQEQAIQTEFENMLLALLERRQQSPDEIMTDEEVDEFIDEMHREIASKFKDGLTVADQQDFLANPAVGRRNDPSPEGIKQSIANVEERINDRLDKIKKAMDTEGGHLLEDDVSTMYDLLREREMLRRLDNFYEKSRQILKDRLQATYSDQQPERVSPDDAPELPDQMTLARIGFAIRDKIAKSVAERADKRISKVADYIQERFGDGPMPWQLVSAEQFAAMSPQEKLDVIRELFTHPLIRGANGRFYAIVPDSAADLEPDQSPHSVTVKAKIFEVDEQGNIISPRPIGNITRQMYPRFKTVNHTKFIIDDPEHKNSGIATIVNGYAMPAYKHLGFNKVDIQAVSDGPYVWPLMGFHQMDDDGNLYGVDEDVEALKRFLRSYKNGFRGGLIRNDDEYILLKAILESDRIAGLSHQELIFALGAGQGDRERDAEVKTWVLTNTSFSMGTMNLTSSEDPRKVVNQPSALDASGPQVDDEAIEALKPSRSTPSGRPASATAPGAPKQWSDPAERTSLLETIADITMLDDPRLRNADSGIVSLPDEAVWRRETDSRMQGANLDATVGRFYDSDGRLTDEGREFNEAVRSVLGGTERRTRVRRQDTNAEQATDAGSPVANRPTVSSFNSPQDNHSDAIPRLTETNEFATVPVGNKGINTRADAEAYRGPLSDVPDQFLKAAIDARSLFANSEDINDYPDEVVDALMQITGQNPRKAIMLIQGLAERFTKSIRNRGLLSDITPEERQLIAALREAGYTMFSAYLGKEGGITFPIGYFELTDDPARIGMGYILKPPDTDDVDYAAGEPMSNYAELAGHLLAGGVGFVNTPPRLVPMSARDKSPHILMDIGLNNSSQRYADGRYSGDEITSRESRFAHALLNAIMGVDDRHSNNGMVFEDNGAMPIDFGTARWPYADGTYLQRYLSMDFLMDTSPWEGYFPGFDTVSNDEFDRVLVEGREAVRAAMADFADRMEAALSRLDALDSAYSGLAESTKQQIRLNLQRSIAYLRTDRAVDSIVSLVVTARATRV